MSPHRIGKGSIKNALGINEERHAELDRILGELLNEKVIKLESPKSEIYVAREPWSDFAYATIPDFDAQDRETKRIRLDIHNLDASCPVRVYMTRKQINSFGLKPGDQILVRLDRSNSKNAIELQALYRDHKRPDKPNVLVGKLKDGRFELYRDKGRRPYPLDKAPANTKETKSRIAEIPHDLNPSRPRLVFAKNQFADYETGEDIDAILARKYNLNPEFRAATLKEAKKARFDGIKAAGRPLCVGYGVDGSNPQEIDDLIFVGRTRSGGFLKRVLIADGAYWLRAQTELDAEAFARGRSIYRPGKDILMLPPTLIKKAELLPETERPAWCVEWEFNSDVELLRTDIYPAMACSLGQLEYGQFANLLYGGDERFSALRELQERIRAKGVPAIYDLKSLTNHFNHQASGSIVEQFMVSANVAVAEFLNKEGSVFPYRNNHPNLNPVIYGQVRQDLQNLGVKNLPEEPADCTRQHLIDILEGRDGAPGLIGMIKNRLREVTNRAHYGLEPSGHMGFGLRHYAHFTSPLRRYADIVAMRAAYRAIRHPNFSALAQTDEGQEQMSSIVAHLNDRDRVEWDIRHNREKHHFLLDLKANEGNEVCFALTDVSPERIVIMHPTFGIRKTISAADLPESVCRINKTDQTLDFANGARASNKDLVRGRIKNVRPSESHWEFEPVLLPDPAA